MLKPLRADRWPSSQISNTDQPHLRTEDFQPVRHLLLIDNQITWELDMPPCPMIRTGACSAYRIALVLPIQTMKERLNIQ